ncbi:hypothetical protein [Hydrogenophaga sp.]|uniref:hypothetical protein n=1 Tax=Hydrogenophaga sp. TaxID=1904254 RepID=UPI0025C05AAD|nr:hypothetical protein [Hydrogenophaga sp.]MBT9464586.1 hypothetical protein [Hydrogenophaga sp.]
MTQQTLNTQTPNTLDLNSIPGKTTVTWQSDETPEERSHRLAKDHRDHLNAIALGWILVLLVGGLGSAAAYAGITADTDGARSAAWTVVAATIAAVPSFFAGRWSSK